MPTDRIPDQDDRSYLEYPFVGVGVVVWKNKKFLLVRGHAWAGDRSVKAVDLSINFGASWLETFLAAPINPYAWQNWNTVINFPQKGYYEIWARATDIAGEMQPMVVPGWNPKGYLNNAMHRIAVNVI